MSSRSPYSQGSGDSYKPPTTQALQTIITGNAQESALVTIDEANRLATHLVEAKLKSSQLRLIFSKVRQIEARWTSDDEQHKQASMREMLLLKPRIMYQSKRISGMEKLAMLLNSLIDLVKTRQDFQRFVDFLEAVVAYHKVNGGAE